MKLEITDFKRLLTRPPSSVDDGKMLVSWKARYLGISSPLAKTNARSEQERRRNYRDDALRNHRDSEPNSFRIPCGLASIGPDRVPHNRTRRHSPRSTRLNPTFRTNT